MNGNALHLNSRWAAGMWAAGLLAAISLAAAPALAADAIDAAVAHPGRPAADLTRDVTDHPAAVLHLAGIKPGMQVLDVLAGDGYYSELLGYIVGPTGHVTLLNNAAFAHWSEPDLPNRIASGRMTNVSHEVVELDDMKLPSASLDAVLLIKVYHDLYWVDSKANSPWPKINVPVVLDQVSKALKKGGVLLVVDHSAKPGSGTADAGTLHRIDQAYALKDFESHGFKLVKKSDLLKTPGDALDQLTYKGPMLGKTDRFILVFKKI
jgi:predicted methyltransferase